MMESPSCTSSPSATHTSITSTPVAPPMSGTDTVCSEGADMVVFCAGFSSAVGVSSFSGVSFFGSSEAASAASTSSSRMSSPSETVSPSFTLIEVILPAIGEGTSIDALSVSNTIIDWSTSIMSPTFTLTSITSTSVAPPISGTRMISVLTEISFVIIDASN